MFNNLSLKLHHIQDTFPDAEEVILGDFDIHNNADVTGLEAESLAITHDFTQLVEKLSSTNIVSN